MAVDLSSFDRELLDGGHGGGAAFAMRLRGMSVTGRTLMMSGGRGSSSGSATLAEALRLGKGRAAILMLDRDAIVVVGAIVAAELYGLALAAAASLTLEAGPNGPAISADL
jgi:predicted aconitase with swiveling domain